MAQIEQMPMLNPIFAWSICHFCLFCQSEGYMSRVMKKTYPVLGVSDQAVQPKMIARDLEFWI